MKKLLTALLIISLITMVLRDAKKHPMHGAECKRPSASGQDDTPADVTSQTLKNRSVIS